jgi:hypothetical protein
MSAPDQALSASAPANPTAAQMVQAGCVLAHQKNKEASNHMIRGFEMLRTGGFHSGRDGNVISRVFNLRKS